MNKQDLLNQLASNPFTIPTNVDQSKLILDNAYFTGLPLFPTKFNDITIYKAVLEGDLMRSGVVACVFIDNDLYQIPVVVDHDLIKPAVGDEPEGPMLKYYRDCMYLSAFASNKAERKELKATMLQLSAPFGYIGEFKSERNKKSDRFPQSYRLQLNKRVPTKVDHTAVRDTLSTIFPTES